MAVSMAQLAKQKKEYKNTDSRTPSASSSTVKSTAAAPAATSMAQLAQQRKEHYKGLASSFGTDYNTFANEYNSFIKLYGRDNGWQASNYWDTASAKYKSVSDNALRLYNTIKQTPELEKSIGMSADEFYERFIKNSAQLSKSFEDSKKYYSQWLTGDAYNKYVTDKNMTAEEAQGAADAATEANKSNGSKLWDYFAMLISGFASSPEASADIVDSSRENIAKINENESTVAYYNQLANQKRVEAIPEEDLPSFGVYAAKKDNYESDSLGRIAGAASGGISMGTTTYRDVAQARQALINKGYSEEVIDSYLQYYENKKTESFTERAQQDIEQHPVLMGAAYTAANIATAPGRGVAALFGVDDFNNQSGAVSSVVTDKIHTSIIDAGGSEWLATLTTQMYQGATSGAESLLRASFGGVGEVLAGLSSATQTYSEAKKRGLSSGAAFMTGVLSGAAEVIFEHISLGNLRLFAQSGKKTVGTYVINILKQFITEGSEEVSTDLANALTDYLVNGGASEISMDIYDNIGIGYSEKQARDMALKKFGEQLTESFVVGGLAGGMSAAAATGIGAVSESAYEYGRNQALGQDIKASGTVNEILQSAYENGYKTDKEVKRNTANVLNAVKKSGSVEGIKDASLGKLAYSVTDNIANTERESAVKEYAKLLEEQGLTEKKAYSTAKAAVKESYNEELDFREKAVLKSSSVVQAREAVAAKETEIAEVAEYKQTLRDRMVQYNNAPISNKAKAAEVEPANGRKVLNPSVDIENKVKAATDADERGNYGAAISKVIGESKTDLKSELIKSGVDSKKAEIAVDVMVKLAEGVEITDAEYAVITDSDVTDGLDRVLPGTARAKSASVATAAKNSVAAKNNDSSIAPAVAASENVENKTESAAAVPARTIDEVAAEYGKQAVAVKATYTQGQDVESFGRAYNYAWSIGKGYGKIEALKDNPMVSSLTAEQVKLAYKTGKSAADALAVSQGETNKANAVSLKTGLKTSRKKGVVIGENGVKVKDIAQTFNVQQDKAYKLLSFYAEATGIDIVLFKSERGSDGKYPNTQGKFTRSDDKIYIDINAGLASVNDDKSLSKYTMLRTFSHEFTHFLEKWSPEQYNGFRQLVFDTLEAKGVDTHYLIELRMSQTEGMSYDAASREVVAEAMTDILPDASFMQELAKNDKRLFNKTMERLKEFLRNLKEYFKALVANPSREANALKETVGDSIKYIEGIVKAYDKLAVEAVENYQKTVSSVVEVETEVASESNTVDETETATKPKTKKKAKTEKKAESGKKAHESAQAANEGGDKSQTDSKHPQNTNDDVENKHEATASDAEAVDTKKTVDDAQEAVEESVQAEAAAEAAPQEEALTATKETGKQKEKRINPSKNKKTVENTAVLSDFGEKIGGARKDWRSEGIILKDLDDMNSREREANVKKDNIWKRADYKKLIEGGADRGILYAVNEIRKALNQKIDYRAAWSEEQREAKQRDFVDTIRQIQSMAEKAESKKDFEDIVKWLIDNEYVKLEKSFNGSIYPRHTNKWNENPALYGSKLLQTLSVVISDKTDLIKNADKINFAVDASSKIPRGFEIRKINVKTETGDTFEKWYITKGAYIIRDNFTSYDEALDFLKKANATQAKKTRFVPPQLLEIHRKGPDYRNSENVSGQNYLDTFKFKGGEFGNWMTAKDRQASLNYGFDALMDLADALGIDYSDISFNGKLSIAFGSRGQGLTSAAAHYEDKRHVINLTKMNGAGSLAHEWFHALDDFIGGYTQSYASNNTQSLPERSMDAMRNLIQTMQYRESTDSETDLAATKRYEQAVRFVEYELKSKFGWIEKVRNGTFTENDAKYFKRIPTQEDVVRYDSLKSRFIAKGDAAAIEELSRLRKEIYGSVLPKENRDTLALRARLSLTPETKARVQHFNVRTEFYNNSREFGNRHSKDGDYWDSTIEMAARAFACYIADKTNKQNDYLSAHSDSTVAVIFDKNGDSKVIKAFPEGAERVAINNAFDNFIEALKADGFLHGQIEGARPDDVQYQSRERINYDNAIFETVSIHEEISTFERIRQDQLRRYMREHKEVIPEVWASYGTDYFYVYSNTSFLEYNLIMKLPIEKYYEQIKIINKAVQNGNFGDNEKTHSMFYAFQSGTGNNRRTDSNTYGGEKRRRNAGLVPHKNGVDNTGNFEKDNRTRQVAKQNIKEQSLDFSLENSENDPQEQQRTQAYTNREVLAMAADKLIATDMDDAQRSALQMFRDKLNTLQELEEKRKEQGRLYKEYTFVKGSVNKEEAAKAKARMGVLDNQIARADEELLKVENTAVLKKVLVEARKVVENTVRAQEVEKLERYRDRRNNSEAVKKYRKRIEQNVNELYKWMLHPGNKDITKHVPEILKDSVIPFLESINFSSKRQLSGGTLTRKDVKFTELLDNVREAFKKNQSIMDEYAGYSDLPENFMDKLEDIIKVSKTLTKDSNGDYVVNLMTASELKELSDIVSNIKAFIKNTNMFLHNSMFQHVDEAAQTSIDYMRSMKPMSHTGAVSNFVLFTQMRPAYVMERFGKGGIAIYDGLRRGQGKLAFNTKEIIDFSNKTYTEKEIKEWESTYHEFELDGDTVRIPVSHIMSFYELLKRKQAKTHIFGNGIRVATFKNGKKISDSGHRITVDEAQRIVESLSDRQREVADSLQKYMARHGGEWGNYVSLARFGVKAFTEDDYFPINTDGRQLANVSADSKPGNSSLYALLNMSFTKELTENASNGIVLYSIFDVFANHMSDMAQYNALALPVLDAMKWFNYRETEKQPSKEDNKKLVIIEKASVRQEMIRAYGAPEESSNGTSRGYAETFFVNILKAFNGTEAQGSSYDSVGLKFLHKYNIAQIAFNARVVVQQPLSVMRAGLIIDYRDILSALKQSPKTIKSNIAEMEKYSGIAAWKGLGFYDVNVSRGVSTLIRHDETVTDKVTEIGMAGAELADKVTWASIWMACKHHVLKSHKAHDAEFYKLTSDLFEEVIYKTQVVDSVLTKNEFMRDKGFWARSVGAFMSEPTTTASMVIDAVDKYNADRRSGMTRQEAWKKHGRNFARTAYVYALSGILLSVVQSVADAWRDDDDYETFPEKIIEAFSGNIIDELSPVNLLPYGNVAWEIGKEIAGAFGADTYGNVSDSPISRIADTSRKAVEIAVDKYTGEKTNYTRYAVIYKLLQTAAGITGLPFATATREVVTAWNNIVGTIAPSLNIEIPFDKITDYDAGEMTKIKYAFTDGYLTDTQAIKELLDKQLVDDENEAWFKVDEWSADGDGYSKYGDLLEAVKNKDSSGVTEAMNVLKEHGISEKQAKSQIKSSIGEWYRSGDISESEAADMLRGRIGMDTDDIDTLITKWDCEVETGVSFGEIQDKYIAGDMLKSEVKEALVKYGDMTAEDAENRIKYWDFKQQYPQYEWSEARVLTYYSTMQPAGISMAHFDSYLDKAALCKGEDSNEDGKTDSGTVKAQVLLVIDALPLTNAQKDVLYYLNSWSEKTITDAPWH